MKNCAIVCEYNPFHTGHRYQIGAVREHGAQNILCVMSGNFVQSAMPAFCDKSIRAGHAVSGGADAVIELPALYATASAGFFAEGALKIISGIRDITHVAMGATADSDLILRIAQLKISHADRYRELLRDNLGLGRSYNASGVAALCELYASKYGETDISAVLSEPNNILCIEYITAIEKYAPGIQPLIIKRVGACHNDAMLDSRYVSATAIRGAIDAGNGDTVRGFVPGYDDVISWRKTCAPDIVAYKKIAVFAMKSAAPETVSHLRNCSEGMEYLLSGMSGLSDYDAFTQSAVCKRYGKKRIDRLMLDCVLGIDRELFDLPFCTRLLACRSGFDFSILPAMVKTKNADIKSAARDKNISRVLGVDVRAAALYNTLCSVDGDYFNYSLVKI